MDKENKKETLAKRFIDGLMKDISEADAVLKREVTAFGNSGHINVGKEFIGKKARVIIVENDDSDYIEFKQVKNKTEDKKDKS